MTPRTVRTGDSDVDALTSGINTQPSSPPTTTAATKGFLTAIAKFKGNLTDKEKAEFDNITTEKHVWDSLKQIQSKQATKNRMLNMNRIKQFIEGLSRYMRLVSCIALGSHDIGAFIWGPLRRLLEKASDFADGFIAIMRSLEQIGEHLPRFEKYSELFKYDERIQEVISWLYGDILEFYLGVLEILRNKLWKVFFRMQWETFDARLNILIGNMKARRKLIDSEAQAAEIEAAQKHRSEEERRQREIEKDNELRQLAELGRLLYSSSSSDDKAGLLEKVCPGTGEWILTHDLVRRWLNGDMALIWITGKPGSGKSVISSIIANELEMNVKSSGNSVALYFFCRGTDGRKSSSLSAVQSLLYQYVEAVPSALPYVYDEVIMRRKVSQRSLATLFESILTMGDPDLPVFLLIDGLDELPIEDIRFLLKTTLHVTGVATSRKRVLVSSRRNVPGMEKAKPRTKKSIWAMEIEGHNDNDIEFYIRSELEEIIEDHDLTIRHPELAKRMVSTLIKGADGMFLWAHLVIDGLLKRRTVAELEQTLTKLPKELMDVYGQILSSMDKTLEGSERMLGYSVLRWISFAKRPLRILELEDLLALKYSGRTIDDRHRPYQQLRDLCGPIIDFTRKRKEDGPEDEVNFVHFTVQQFLLDAEYGPNSKPYLDKSTCLSSIGEDVMRYQNFECFDTVIDERRKEDIVRNGDLRLLDYMQRYWLYHIEDLFSHGHGTDVQRQILTALWGLVQSKLSFCTEVPTLSTEGLYTHPLPSLYAAIFNPQLTEPQNAVLGLRLFLDFFYRLTDKEKSIEDPSDLGSWIHENDFLGNWKRELELKQLQERIISVSVDSGDQAQLAGLQRLYGALKFRCRYSQCPHSKTDGDGFKSTRDRNEHEKKAHPTSYRCPKLDCIYHEKRLQSTSALRAHMARYHNEKTIPMPFRLNAELHKKDSKEFGLGADPEFGLYFEPGNHDTLLDQLESKEKVELLKDGGATERVLDADTRKAEFMRRIHLASEEACQALAYAGCPVKDVSALWDGYVGQPIGPLAVDR